MKKYTNCLIALIPAILVFFLILKEPFYGLDCMITDSLYSQMNGTGNDIKIIAIDEESLTEYGPLAEWSRDKSTALLNRLYEDDSKSPAVVAFDIMFIGDDDKSVDEGLVEASEGKNVVSATNIVYRGTTRYDSNGMPYYDARNIEMEERPFSALNEVVESGFANADISKDGFVRSARTSVDINGEQRYSFAAQVYRTYMSSLSKGKEADDYLKGKKQTYFYYSGKPGEFEHYSLKDVLDGKIPGEAFKDCIVYVGAYAPGLQDSYHSAAKRGTDMYGVEINANITRALMLDKTANKINPLYVALVAAVLFFIYTLLAQKMSMYPAVLSGLWIVIIDVVTGKVLSMNGKLISQIYTIIVWVLVSAFIIIQKYLWEKIKKRQVINSFKKYMAPQVIDQMAKDDEFEFELGGVRRDVAVLFVDIRGFTSLSEALTPEEIVRILNRYLTLTSECIFEYGGMVDKFVGDCTMAIFNAPNDQEDYVFKAVQAGILMKEKGEVLGKELEEEYGRRVSFGIGIHTGPAVVGNIGSERRMDYTAIGDTVNTASRIESKSGAGELLVSEEVFIQLEGRINAEFKEKMTLKGKAKPVKVYIVKGI